MPDADYDHINDNDYLSAYDEDDNKENDLLSRFIGYYHFAKRDGIDRVKWFYRGTKWYARSVVYRIKYGYWPSPYTHTDNAVYKYGYIYRAWIKTVDELSFLPVHINAMLHQLTDKRELLFTTEEAD